jgi:hypothetical protein
MLGKDGNALDKGGAHLILQGKGLLRFANKGSARLGLGFSFISIILVPNKLPNCWLGNKLVY